MYIYRAIDNEARKGDRGEIGEVRRSMGERQGNGDREGEGGGESWLEGEKSGGGVEDRREEMGRGGRTGVRRERPRRTVWGKFRKVWRGLFETSALAGFQNLEFNQAPSHSPDQLVVKGEAISFLFDIVVFLS